MKLVKVLIITLEILLAVGTAFSQETYLEVLLNYSPTNFHYGESNSELKDFKKNVRGLQAGVSFQAGITSNFSLLSEFYFMMKGGALIENNPLNTTASKTRLFALELPVLARVHIGNVYLNAGPSLAYNFAGKVKTEGSEAIPRQFYNISFDGSEGSYKRWDAGLQFGAGYELKLKKVRVAFDARYQYGLVNQFNGAEKYNRAFVFNIQLSKPWKSNPLAKRNW